MCWGRRVLFSGVRRHALVWAVPCAIAQRRHYFSESGSWPIGVLAPRVARASTMAHASTKSVGVPGLRCWRRATHVSRACSALRFGHTRGTSRWRTRKGWQPRGYPHPGWRIRRARQRRNQTTRDVAPPPGESSEQCNAPGRHLGNTVQVADISPRMGPAIQIGMRTPSRRRVTVRIRRARGRYTSEAWLVASDWLGRFAFNRGARPAFRKSSATRVAC